MWLRAQAHRCIQLLLIVFFAASGLIILPVYPAQAVEFSSLTIRPDRTKAGVAPGAILIQAKVSETVTEDGLRLLLGSAWSGSSISSAYTVSTSNLPSGVAAWPGIDTSTAVSGQEITFPSDDLAAGTTYGFYLTGGISSNPTTAGSTAAYLWTMSTLVAGNPASVSDALVAIVPNDQIAISAAISPPSGDYTAVLSTSDDTNEIPQDTTLTYTITYGSEYDFATPLTIQAEWSEGTIAGNGVPTVELLEYVPGSASQAYGSTSPIVNLIDRTVTWTIASFPGNTSNQTVTFQLQTTDQYRDSSLVTASVFARIIEPVSTVDSTSTMSYTYAQTVTPSPSPSPSSTPTTSPTPSASPNVTPSPTPTVVVEPTFVNYSLQEVLDTRFTLNVLLSSASPLTVRYGRNPNELTEVQTLSSALQHTVTVTDLLPNTVYFIQLRIPQPDGTEIASELLQFTTTQAGTLPIATTVSITSNGIHLWSGSITTNQPFLVPAGQTIELALQLENDETVSSIVLQHGHGEQNHYLTNLSRTQAGTWSGRLILPTKSEPVELVAVIHTSTGGTLQVPIFVLRVAPAARVLDSISNQPIERARVLIYRQDAVSQLFSQLSAPAHLAENPVLTTNDGQIPLVLSPGVYRLEVSAIGYESSTVTFSTISDTSFPTIRLDPTGIAVLNELEFHAETVVLKVQQVLETIKTEAQSSATIELVTLWTVAVSAPLSAAGVLAQAHFSVATLVGTVLHQSSFVLGNTLSSGASAFIPGSVLGAQTNQPIHTAVISVMDQNGKTQAILQPHRDGSFAIPTKVLQESSSLVAMAPGFAPQSISIDRTARSVALSLSPSATSSWKAAAQAVIKRLLVNLFELNLAISLALGLAFTFLYNSPAAIPFLVVSSLNASIFTVSRLSAFLHRVHFS